MKDLIPKLTEVCKQLAAIREAHALRNGSKATNDMIRDIEQEVADLRELFNYD